MENAVISLKDIFWACGAMATIYGAYKIVKEIRKPNEDLKEKVSFHDECLANDKKRIDGIEECQKMILRSVISLVNHQITGNGIDNMKKVINEVNEYLVNK